MLSVVTLFVSARYLGPEGRGVFAAAISWVALFATVANLSLGQALQYRLQSEQKLSLPAQIGTLGGLAIGVSFIALLVAVGLFFATEGSMFRGLDPVILGLAFVALPLLVWEQFSSNVLSAISRLDLYSRAQYIGRSIALVLFVLLVARFGFGVPGALVAQAVGPAIIAALVTIPLVRLAGGVKWVKAEVAPLLKAGAKVHITTVSAFMLDQISILLINNYLTKAEVGHYQLAQQMVALMLVIPQAALMVIYGGLAKSDPDAFWPEQRRLLRKVMVLIIGVGLVAYLVVPYVILSVAGQAFEPSVAIFRALLPTLLGVSLATMMTPQWIGRGMFLLNNMLTLVSAVIVIVASWLLIPKFGVDGAIWVRLCVYLGLVTITQLIFWGWCSASSKNK